MVNDFFLNPKSPSVSMASCTGRLYFSNTLFPLFLKYLGQVNNLVAPVCMIMMHHIDVKMTTDSDICAPVIRRCGFFMFHFHA